MAHTFARIVIHLVFSTRDRHPFLSDDFRPELHKYMNGVLERIGCPALEINSEPDHVHVVFLMSRTISMAEVVREFKRATSVWLRRPDLAIGDFHWQGGYGAFSISEEHLPALRSYVQNQREHHWNESFQDEHRRCLQENEVEYDEKWVWE